MNARVPLPAGTTLGKSFEHGLDINIGLQGTPSWQAMRRMSGFAPTFPETTEPVTSYDDLGASNDEVTGRSVVISFTVQGNRSLTTGLLLPELEALLTAAKSKGEAAVIDARWYHKPEFGTPNPNDAAVRASASLQLARTPVTRRTRCTPSPSRARASSRRSRTLSPGGGRRHRRSLESRHSGRAPESSSSRMVRACSARPESPSTEFLSTNWSA